MGDRNERAARSATRSFWVDPRFAIGVVLVVGSVVGVSFVVASVDDSIEVYSARAMMPAGTTVTAKDLDIASVRLGTSSGSYLTVDELPKEGLVLSRAVAAGELLPIAALDERSSLNHTSVVVTVGGDVAAAVTPGASVDLWAAPQLEHGRFGSPAVVVSSAEVVKVNEGGGFMGGDSGRSVELRVSTSRIAAVLQATANGDSLSLVPANPDAREAEEGQQNDAPATPGPEQAPAGPGPSGTPQASDTPSALSPNSLSPAEPRA